MSGRRLVLFDVDGVLVRPGESRRLAGAAEALARLRGAGDAVLSVLTGDREDEARRKTGVVGVDRYLDFEVGAYGATAEDGFDLVSAARQKAQDSYQDDFTVLVVTAASAADVARARPDADVVVAIAADAEAPGLRAAGADHVVRDLPAVEELAGDARVG